MSLTDTIPTQPIDVPRTLRRDRKRVLSSGKAGKIQPIAAIPMFREERLARGEFTLQIDMAETPQTLMNGIAVTVMAHFIPFLSFERFNGLDQFNRSYMGIPETEGGTPVPFFKTATAVEDVERVLGVHPKAGQFNVSYREAYNALVNELYRARSPKLPLRSSTQGDLAAALWQDPQVRNILPDFDSAMIDGEVPLSIIGAQLPLKKGSATLSQLPVAGLFHDSNGTPEVLYDMSGTYQGNLAAAGVYVKKSTGNVANPLPRVDFTGVFAEMSNSGLKISLSNLELAKKTAAFARLRSQFDGIDDDYIVDLLMQAVRVPEQAMSRPILLDKKTTLMGYSKRYATDGANLDASVTTGKTVVDLRMRTPEMNTGGIILITCQIVPERMFERWQDHFVQALTPEHLPQFLRDFLDPEKVDVVKNSWVDVKHTNPDGVFGYQPLNEKWNRDLVNIGGKYYRPDTNTTFDEDRQALWAVEEIDPQLTEDWYLATNIHSKVFADTVADQFKYQGRGQFDIVGTTVFGERIYEDEGNYSAVVSEVDQTRIAQ